MTCRFRLFLILFAPLFTRRLPGGGAKRRSCCSQHSANRALNIYTLVVISRSWEAAWLYSPSWKIKTIYPMWDLLTFCSIYTTPALNACNIFWPTAPSRLWAAWTEWPIGFMMIQFSKIIFSPFPQMSVIWKGQFARNHSFRLIVGAVGHLARGETRCGCSEGKFHIITTFVWMQHDSVMTILEKWKFHADFVSCNILCIQCFSPSLPFPREPKMASAPS